MKEDMHRLEEFGVSLPKGVCTVQTDKKIAKAFTTVNN